MDLNELFKQHQIALIKAQYAADRVAGTDCCLIDHYARRIRTTRIAMGATQT